MVHNENLITLNLYYKLVSRRDDGSYNIACGEGSDEPAGTHDPPKLSLLTSTKYES